MHGAGGAVFILIIKQMSINKHNGMMIPKFDSLLCHSAQRIAKFRPFWNRDVVWKKMSCNCNCPQAWTMNHILPTNEESVPTWLSWFYDAAGWL